MSRKPVKPTPKSQASEQAIEKYVLKYGDIVSKDPNDSEMFIYKQCSSQSIEVSAKWLSVEGHLRSKAHQNNIISKKPEVINVEDLSYEEEEEEEEELKTNPNKEEPLKSNELGLNLQISRYILENAAPFSFVNTFLTFTQQIVTNFEPEVVKRAHMSSTTLQNLVSYKLHRQKVKERYL